MALLIEEKENPETLWFCEGDYLFVIIILMHLCFSEGSSPFIYTCMGASMCFVFEFLYVCDDWWFC